jgi:plastocyanin
LKKLRRSLFAMGLAAIALLPLLVMGGGSAAAASATIKLKAGNGETGYAVNQYLPNAATVTTGDVVHWDFPWKEPHTVTFGTPTGDPTVSPTPFPTAPVPYDGTGSITSGLIGTDFSLGPPGSPMPNSFEVKFTKAGTFPFFCAIHPNMTGTITVVDSGTVSKQSDLDAAAATAYAADLATLKAAAASQKQTDTVTANTDGTKLHTLQIASPNDVLVGDVNQYFPPTVNITAGDSVTWNSNVHTPHTVTFGAPPPADPFSLPPSTADFPTTGYANSGIIGLEQDPDYGHTFTLKFSKAGTFNYFCLLHAPQGMVGQVVVAAAPAPTSTPTVAPTKTATAAPGAPNTGSGSASGGLDGMYLLAGAVAIALAMSGTAVFAVKRSK